MWPEILKRPSLVLLAAAALISPRAFALTGTFDVSMGFSSLEIVAGKGFNQVMESLTTVEVRYQVNFDSINSAFGLGVSEILESDFGPLSYTRMDVGGRWYPFGLNGTRKVLDNETEGKFWNTKPFMALGFGLANLSVDAGSDAEFNAVMFDLSARVGLEIPAGTNFLVLGQLGYLFSLTSFADADELSAVDYSGFQLWAGIRITPF